MKGVVKYPQTFIELFAGCGGNVLGFIKAGLKCVAAVERDPGACYTMWSNLALPGWTAFKVDEEQLPKLQKIMDKWRDTGMRHMLDLPIGDDWVEQTDEVHPILQVYCADVNNIEPEEVMESLGLNPGELGIIAGGPPCQGFSTANTNRHMLDERNQLPLRFLHFVNVFKPAIFQIENVLGIISLGREKGQTEGPFIHWLRERANEIGYSFEYAIHNACDYGVPQRRKRVIFIGIRQDLYDSGMRYSGPEPTHSWSFHEALEQGTVQQMIDTGMQAYVNVQEAIGDLTKFQIGALRDSDAKKYPEGHKNRRANVADAQNIRNVHGYFWYRDKFTDNWFKGNHIADYSQDKMDYYMSCRYCQKLNLMIRKQCHYCSEELLTADDFNYLQ